MVTLSQCLQTSHYVYSLQVQTYKIYKDEFLHLNVNEITKSNKIFIKKETFPEYKKVLRGKGEYLFFTSYVI